MAVLAATFLAVASFHIAHDSKGALPPEFAALAIWAGLGALVWRIGRNARGGVSAAERRVLLREG